MKIGKRNLHYILLAALVILSLSLLSCNFITWPSELAGKVEEVATKVAREFVEVEKPVIRTVVVEVTRIVEVEVLVTPNPVPPSISTPTLPAETPPTATWSQLDVESQILTEVYRKVNPSVVNIRTDQGQASGFVWDTEGHVVTNNHVVRGAREVLVTFADGLSLPAEVIGEDPDSDLAVLEVDPEMHELHPVELGDVDEVQVGDRAIAIGNPFGFDGTLTQGIVSAIGRTIPSLTDFNIPEAIQTDAAINPGNSGGPLLDSQGRVIGVNTMISSRSGSSAGVGFAVPINIAKQVVPVLIEKGYYAYPWLGISGPSKLMPELVEVLSLSSSQGAYVNYVTPHGPADRAGVRSGTEETGLFLYNEPLKAGGDLIIAINGQPVREFDDLIIYLVRETRPGQEVELTIIRDGKEMQLLVKLEERPETIERE